MRRAPVYTVRQRFGPADAEPWTSYVKWSGLSHLSEVVSLDRVLWPSPLGELVADDWLHNVQADFRLDLFRDLPYLLRRTGNLLNVNVLAVIDDPEQADLAWTDPGFEFAGFDLVEDATGVSAVNNCGGFKGLFTPTTVARNGLIADLEHAIVLRRQLRADHPDEPHADCVLWAVRLRRR